MAILTISRQFGSGGREIGHAVAARMGYEYINKERLLEDIRADGVKWEEFAKNLDEHYPSVWEKYDWSFRGFGALLQSHLLEHASRDRVILIGRGGNFLLDGIPHALRIRVVAPLANRIERIMIRESVDRNGAQWLAEKTDRGRGNFIYTLYGKHWDTASEYDMVFDSGQESLDQITDMTEAALRARDRSATEEGRTLLYGRALAAKIKAAIATDPTFFLPTLDTHYDGQEIILEGVIHSPAEHKRVEDAAKRLAGKVPVKCRLHYRV